MAGKIVYLSDIDYGTKLPRGKLSKQGNLVQIACAKTPLGLLEMYRYQSFVIVTLDGKVVGKEMTVDLAIESAYVYLKKRYDRDMVWRSLKLLSYAVTDHSCIDYKTFNL